MTKKWESRDDNSDDDNGKTLVPAIFFSRCSRYFRYELPPTSAVEVYVRRRQAEDRHFGFQYQGSIEESISVPVATLKPLRGQILFSVAVDRVKFWRRPKPRFEYPGVRQDLW